MKIVSIWGSTGSIGRQTLDVIKNHPDNFRVSTLTTNSNINLLIKQIEHFRPRRVVVASSDLRARWEAELKERGVDVFWGREGLLEIAAMGDEDVVVNGLVGCAGLESTIRAIEAGVSIALANKEVLVMAGEIVMKEAEDRGVEIFPIDSEHSAIYQCLRGEEIDRIKIIYLTASGGPFLNRSATEMKSVTVEEALNHPNWSMGRKITIDSATLMNKGMEIIEACWLFRVRPDKVRVVIHPQSIIHSMVEFIDGSIKAQLGFPDMRIPISYALAAPERLEADYVRPIFNKPVQMSFMPPDTEKFPALNLAYEAIRLGGSAPAVLSCADERAVELFLNRKIRFDHIPVIVAQVLEKHDVIPKPGLEEILNVDNWVREIIQKEVLPNLKD